MDNTEQLLKKDCQTGQYSKIYPVTSLQQIKDLSTGKTLDEILAQYNHIYLDFIGNSKALTRQQVPMNQRRRGLYITYVSCAGNTITEWYNSDDFSNKAWGDNANWVRALDQDKVQEMIDEVKLWYKA